MHTYLQYIHKTLPWLGFNLIFHTPRPDFCVCRKKSARLTRLLYRDNEITSYHKKSTVKYKNKYLAVLSFRMYLLHMVSNNGSSGQLISSPSRNKTKWVLPMLCFMVWSGFVLNTINLSSIWACICTLFSSGENTTWEFTTCPQPPSPFQ